MIRKSCESCGKYGYHQSYDSSRFITLYFIPVVPLGSKKIISDCPYCKNTLIVSKREWKDLRKKDLTREVEDYLKDPGSQEKAKKAITIAVQCHGRAQLLKIAPLIKENLSHSSEISALMAQAFSFLCMDAEADEAYLNALEKDSSKEIAEQSELHMQAKELPKPIPKNRLLQSLPVLIVPTILIYFLSVLASDSVSSKIDNAYLINGLDVPYDVSINGKRYTLRANQEAFINAIRYGDNRIEPVQPTSLIKPIQFTVSLPWYKRAFNAPYIVVNPDRTSVLLWEETEYTTTNDGAYEYSLETGEGYYIYPKINYFFKFFPDEIDLPSTSSRVSKTRLSSMKDYSDTDLLQTLINHNNENSAFFLAERLRLEPESESLIPYASALLPAEEFLEIIKERLDRVPIQIEAHRFYQNTIEDKEPGHDLLAEYEARYTANPNDPAAVYLLARVVEDVPDSLELFEQALALPNEKGFAANALAYHCLLEGEVLEAMEYAAVAMERSPQNASFQNIRNLALIANRSASRLEEVAQEGLSIDPFDTGSFSLFASALAMNGRETAARSEIEKFCKQLRDDGYYDPDIVSQIRTYLLSNLAAQNGNRSDYLNLISRGVAPDWDFQIAVLKGELENALNLLEESEGESSGYEHLMVYMLALDSGDQALASKSLTGAKEIFNKGNANQRKWVGWLNADRAPDFEELKHACYEIDQHYIIFAAFAHHFPESKDVFLTHAKKIKFKGDFSAMVLSDLISTSSVI
ncbi:MAG: hypothetical protein AAF546_07030 [Verrucomicrobiota bacterium]